MRVERDAVGQAAQVGGAEDFAVDQPDFAWPGLVQPHAGDARAGGFHDVQPLLAGVEPDFVGEVKSVGHHADAAIFDHRHIAVAHAVGKRQVHGFTRVETVSQTRSLVSRSTKLTLPMGWPSMLSISVRVRPSRSMISSRSVPKLEIRMLPSAVKARPLGSVPCV